jgi:diguanylate cyclase (GGDEF)-like protein
LADGKDVSGFVAPLLVTVAYGIALVATISAAVTGFAPVDQVSGPAMVLLGLVAVVFAVRAARQRRLDTRTRRAWKVLAGAFVLLFATPVLFFAVTGARPFPQPGDATHLASVLTIAVGLQFFPLASASRRDRAKALLDSAIVVAGVSMVMWYLVVGPALTRNYADTHVVVAACALSVADLTALFGLARVLLRGTDRSVRGPLWLLAAGLLVFTIGDIYLGYMQAHVTSVERTPWQFVCWLTMHYLVAMSAVEQCRAGAAGPSPTQVRGFASKLPYLGVAAGYSLMVVATLHEAQAYPWPGLAVGAIILTGLVVLRQSFAQRDSDDAAATDSLTGLANRAKLHTVLARALERDARAGRHTGVLLIDLNGFKQVNDTLGHQAGDTLLVGVADALSRSVRVGTVAGRLGGDEFAVVLPGIGGEADAVSVATRLTEALATPVDVGDRTVRPAASIGVAVGGPGEMTVDELLHHADLQMYRAKRQETSWSAPSATG